jgi:hypothetical protein
LGQSRRVEYCRLADRESLCCRGAVSWATFSKQDVRKPTGGWQALRCAVLNLRVPQPLCFSSMRRFLLIFVSSSPDSRRTNRLTPNDSEWLGGDSRHQFTRLRDSCCQFDPHRHYHIRVAAFGPGKIRTLKLRPPFFFQLHEPNCHSLGLTSSSRFCSRIGLGRSRRLHEITAAVIQSDTGARLVKLAANERTHNSNRSVQSH